MEQEKLSQTALSASMKYDPDNEFYNQDFYQGFMSGAEWLQAQPIADRLTEREREKIKGFYKEAEELEIYGARESDRSEGRAFIVVFHSIFGKEMFENEE